MRNQDRYRKKFGVDEDGGKKAALALDYALDIRKFEIDLYWKRTAYFWTLIAVAFAGFFSVLSARFMETEEKSSYAYVIGTVGFVFTFAWFLANKGSKFWQENWENHVDMLEDAVIGPLYKTILHRPMRKEVQNFGDFVGRHVTGPARFSVSSINAWVSLFTLGVWVLLLWQTAAIDFGSPIDLYKVGSTLLGGLACGLMCGFGKTHTGSYHHKMRSRRTKIL